MAADLYHIRRLEHGYNAQTILEINELSISESSITGLIGPNGSGKSTLLRILGFIETPRSGEVRFMNAPAAPFSPLVRFQVSLLTQTPYLMKRSVKKNIAYGLQLRGDTDHLDARVREALELVGLCPKEFSARQWCELSGGEAQRVALAARLALKPKVLLLDEPTASIDVASAQRIRDASLQARGQWGATLVIASHDWQWLHEICDDVIHLFKGKRLSAGHETILFGPWEPADNGFWKRALPDGQSVFVSPPPHAEAAAVLPAAALAVQMPNGAPPRCALTGTVSRLTLEKRTRQVIATLHAGDLPVTIKFTAQQATDLALLPGTRLTLRYDPDAVQWV